MNNSDETVKKVRALVVDDEANLRQLLSLALGAEGWEVKTAETGAEAIELFDSYRPDIAVLDVMLPDISGIDLLGKLRSVYPKVPVLFLTARSSVEDRVAGLTAGGDDYVAKPFSLEEVVARLHGLARRADVEGEKSHKIVAGDLTLDEDTREVFRGDREIVLAKTEFALLAYFMKNPRRVLSKAQILDRVWNYEYNGNTNVVELYVSYLRKKITLEGEAELIHTARGVGYVLKPIVKS